MPNAVKLPHKLDRKTMTCQAVIETPKGARSKFDYDEENELFRLAGLLPEGMSFPLDFGFFPSTDVRGVHGPDRAADALEKATKADPASGSAI